MATHTPSVDTFGFLEPPFDPTPDPRFAYASQSFSDAIRDVVTGQDRGESVRVVSGPAGAGKSMLCRTLPEHLVGRTFVSLILEPPAHADALARRLLADFQVAQKAIKLPGPSPINLADVLRGLVASLVRHKSSAALVIDSAHELPLSVVKTLLTFSSEDGAALLLQIVLAVPETLWSDPASVEKATLLGSAPRSVLKPLTNAEVVMYVERRLWIARGGTAGLSSLSGLDSAVSLAAARLRRPRFEASAIRVIADASDGIPRTVNRICDRALLVARARDTDQINRSIAERATRDLELGAAARSPRTWFRTVAVTAVIVVGLGATAAWFGLKQARSGSRAPAVEAARVPATDVAKPSSLPARPTIAEPTTSTSAAAHLLPTSDPVVVVVASFGSAARAEVLVGELESRGFPAFSSPGDGARALHLVLVGPYASREDAIAPQQRLSRDFPGAAVEILRH